MWSLRDWEGSGKGKPRPARATRGASGVTEGVGEPGGRAPRRSPPSGPVAAQGVAGQSSAWRRTAPGRQPAAPAPRV